MVPDSAALIKEITFKTSRSGGKGGQHVNKVSSKVELLFNVNTSELFTADQKLRIIEKLESRIDTEGILHLVSQENRSQLLNRRKVIVKLCELLGQALKVPKKRNPTKIPRAVIESRLTSKMLRASKKESRKKPDWE